MLGRSPGLSEKQDYGEVRLPWEENLGRRSRAVEGEGVTGTAVPSPSQTESRLSLYTWDSSVLATLDATKSGCEREAMGGRMGIGRVPAEE